jgi:hypothetical protein
LVDPYVSSALRPVCSGFVGAGGERRWEWDWRWRVVVVIKGGKVKREEVEITLCWPLLHV